MVLPQDGADAALRGFTITGAGNSVKVIASAPLIEDMAFDGVGDQWWTYTGSGWDGYEEASPSILVELFAEPTIQNNLFDGGGEIEIIGEGDLEGVTWTLSLGVAADVEGLEHAVNGNVATDHRVVGILDQLEGPGIVFDSVEARFDLTPERLLLREAAAVA